MGENSAISWTTHTYAVTTMTGPYLFDRFRVDQDWVATPEATALAGFSGNRNTHYTIGHRAARLLDPSFPMPGPGGRLFWSPAGIRALAVLKVLNGFPAKVRRPAAIAAAAWDVDRPGWVAVQYQPDAMDDLMAVTVHDRPADTKGALYPHRGYVSIVAPIWKDPRT